MAGRVRGGAIRDTGWNLAGLLLPLPVAVAVVPSLLAGLGEARFGLLTLAWAVMGYFTLFDFGLGRATTHGVAQALGCDDRPHLLRLCWTSGWAHLGMGVVGGLVLVGVAPPMGRLLGLEASLQAEFIAAMTWLACSIPLIVVATAARGVLEGLGRFDAVNLVRLPGTLWTYVAPWTVLYWTSSLTTVMAAIALGRVLVLLGFLFACVRSLPALATPLAPRPAVLAPLLQMGLWLTVSTVGVPIMSTLDRMVIGTQVSVEAVGWYAAPYEAVTKLWIIAIATMTVAFPAFARAAATQPDALGGLLRHAIAALVICVLPVSVVIVVVAPVLIPLWLGDAAGRETVVVTQWLAVGMAISVPAQAGGTLLQASGRADWVARVQVVSVVCYGLAIWWGAERWGIEGVALLWAVRSALAGVALVVLAGRWTGHLGGEVLGGRHVSPLAATALGCMGWTWLHAAAMPSLDLAWALVTVLVAGVPCVWVWYALVDDEMRHSLTGRLRTRLGV